MLNAMHAWSAQATKGLLAPLCFVTTARSAKLMANPSCRVSSAHEDSLRRLALPVLGRAALLGCAAAAAPGTEAGRTTGMGGSVGRTTPGGSGQSPVCMLIIFSSSLSPCTLNGVLCWQNLSELRSLLAMGGHYHGSP